MNNALHIIQFDRSSVHKQNIKNITQKGAQS